VVLGGFSRSDNESLAAALAEATGAKRDDSWIIELTRALEMNHHRQKRLRIGVDDGIEGPP
jgi:hypothetical protein